MTRATRDEEYRGAERWLHLAFELGVSEWKLGFATELGEKARIRVLPARDVKRLEREIAEAKRRLGLASTSPVRSCYEAGRDGFWLHRYLMSRGVENLVVDSSSIEVNRRARRAKSDGLDVRKLLTMLLRYHAGEAKVWSVVRVPTVAEEDGRQLHRELRTLKKERTRVTNRIKGLLANQGIRLEKNVPVGEVLEELRLWDGSALAPSLKDRLRREWELAEYLHRTILELERERQRAIRESRARSMEKVRQLFLLKGIGTSGSWVLVQEFFGWRRFRNRKEVGALAGLVPTPYQSGDGSREQGISKAGNRHIRAVAIELAWCWLQHQPQSGLSVWYQKRFGRGGKRARKVGIVALARKLLIALWRFVEYGEIPEGAALKA
jgi:transposase